MKNNGHGALHGVCGSVVHHNRWWAQCDEMFWRSNTTCSLYVRNTYTINIQITASDTLPWIDAWMPDHNISIYRYGQHGK